MTPEFDIPKKGYYYSCDHKPSDELNHEAWEVMGLGKQKETGSYLVAMRSLFAETKLLPTPEDFILVPLTSFNRKAKRGKSSIPSYSKITNQDTIEKLNWFRKRIYPAG